MAEPAHPPILNKETWRQEALAAIDDIRKHVKRAVISPLVLSNSQRVYINITTLENREYCIEMSAAGFRVVGRSHNDTCFSIIETVYYETPYSLLNTISEGYRQSFGGELMNKLLSLANEQQIGPA